VVKKLHAIRLERIQLEVKIMEALCGGPNIIQLLDIYCNDPSSPSKTTRFVYEYIPNRYYKTVFPSLSSHDLKLYLYLTLMAIQYSHEHGVMHRDLKPNNIMIDTHTKQVRVIDWGLADFYFPKNKYSTHIATRMYKAPEVLLQYTTYDYSFDMWTFGVILASAIFNRQPLFTGRDDLDMFYRINEMLGNEDALEFINHYNIQLTPKNNFVLLSGHKKIHFGDFVTLQNSQWVSWQAIELIEKLMQYDPAHRLSAHEAMEHPFFDEVREEARSHTTNNIQPCMKWST